MQIDLNLWQQRAEPQRPGREWCWAASLAAVARFQVDTLVTQETFVMTLFGNLETTLTPDWGTYSQLLRCLHEQGLEYHRQQSGIRRLEFDCVLQPGFDAALVLGCLQRGLPVITTIQGGAHDLVIVGVDLDGHTIGTVHYWNPADNGIGHMSLAGFLGFEVVATVAAVITPVLEQIAFVSGGIL
ncbi:MAG TPA: papain-like cysteine protease family protein [Bryobacteraceae bacterium]|nr:papain-like cysteine protease family protein [Bryobacteraceae bacterium]